MHRLARFAWVTLAVNVAVIVFGAFVRASGSGAGCGAHWPTCHGEIVPSAIEGARAIEFTHRLSSGLALILVAVLAVGAFRSFPPGHRVRKAATWSAVFVLGEAAIGAMLVLFEWVADDTSVARAVAVPLHLVNTLGLLAALTLTARWAGGAPPMRLRGSKAWAVYGVGFGLVLVAASGGVTALADTLFPSESIAHGLAQSFAEAEHFLTRLRVAHPLIAIVVGVSLIWLIGRFGTSTRTGRLIGALVVVQFVAGAANIVLLTPEWLQLVHLALADTLWIAFVAYVSEVFAVEQASQLT